MEGPATSGCAVTQACRHARLGHAILPRANIGGY